MRFCLIIVRVGGIDSAFAACAAAVPRSDPSPHPIPEPIIGAGLPILGIGFGAIGSSGGSPQAGLISKFDGTQRFAALSQLRPGATLRRAFSMLK
jgi:hypothetical protein